MIGTRVGSYHILSHIGAGGMGEVHLARDTKLGRNVAIHSLTRAQTSPITVILNWKPER